MLDDHFFEFWLNGHGHFHGPVSKLVTMVSLQECVVHSPRNHQKKRKTETFGKKILEQFLSKEGSLKKVLNERNCHIEDFQIGATLSQLVADRIVFFSTGPDLLTKIR